MANKIKGITVEIGGDTTKLADALKGVNGDISKTQKELNQVNRLLKFDPKNIELLGQKQKLLTEQISATASKLDKLKGAAANAKRDLDVGKATAEDYRYLQRQVIEAEQALEKLKKQAADTGGQLEKSGKNVHDFGAAAGKLSEKTRGLSTAMGGVIAAAVATVPATDDLRASLSLLETNTEAAGIAMDTAREKFHQFYVLTGETDSSVEALSNLMQTGFDDSQIAAAVDALSGAVVRFPDTLKIESLADSLQETVASGKATGQFAELMDRLGISAEAVTKSMEGYTSEQDRLQIALSALTSTGLPAAYEAWEKDNQALIDNRDSQLRMQESLAKLSETLAPIITDVTNFATKLTDWFNGLSGPGKVAVGVFAGIAASISPISGAIDGVLKIAPHMLKFVETLNVKTAATVGAFGLLVVLISEIAKSWDKMTNTEKVLAALGAIAVAAAATAIALGAITGPAGAAMAAAGIVGGIAVAGAAIHRANKRAETKHLQEPAPNSYAALYGNPNAQQGGGYGGQQYGGNQTVVLEMDGVAFGNVALPHIQQAQQRAGVNLAGGY